MFTCSRPFLKRCGLSTLRADHAAGRSPHPDEPLLFLYPRWFISTARGQRRLVNTVLCRRHISHGNPRELSCTRQRSPARKQSFGASSSRRWLSRGSTPLLPKIDSDEVVEPTSERESAAAATRTNTAEEGKSTDTVEKNEIFEVFTKLEHEAYRHIDLSLLEHNWDILSEPEGGHSKGLLSEETIKERKNHIFQQLPRRQARKIVLRQSYLGGIKAEHRISIYEKLREYLERAELRAQDGRFRRPEFYTVQDPQRREILVPDETIAILAGVSEGFSQSENIWFLSLRHGCRVHVLPSVESVGNRRRVVLWGSKRATELVEARFLKTQELQDRGDPLVEIKKPPVPVYPSRLALERSGTLTPLLRGVWDYKSTSRPRVNFEVLVRKSASIYNVRGFMKHVENLTASIPSTKLSPPGGQPHADQPHAKQVAGALWQLFCDEDKQHLMSTMALNIAISFLLRHRFINYVEKLIIHAGHVASTDTFNMILKYTGQQQNLFLFGHTLRLMSRYKLRPDVHTWLAYLDCLVSPAAKTGLIEVIAKKGYLQDPYTMRSVLRLMVNELLINHLKDGGSMDEFFNKIATTAGLNWFPASLIRKMLAVVAQLEDPSAMKRLLEICRENNLPLSAEMVGDFVSLFPADTFTALDYTIKCLEYPNCSLNKESYARLFVNARKNMHYNLCRVLWRYACMDEAVPRSMRDDLAYLLFQNIASETLSEQDRLWKTCAGKVIVGVDLHLPDYALKDDLLQVIPHEFHDNPVASLLASRRLEGEEREKQRTAAKAILKHDMEVGPWYRPVFSLAHMLEAASELDREWGDVPRPLKWLMQHAIHVPIEFVGPELKKI